MPTEQESKTRPKKGNANATREEEIAFMLMNNASNPLDSFVEGFG
jgi:hypothetical protein